MASQLALDFCRYRLRAVEIDGHAKGAKVKAFVAVDVAAPAAPAEGQPAAPWRWADAAKELVAKKRLVREPSAIAVASIDCTFRDLELPFTGAGEIDKVIKFEAESQLQQVDIDSVVVTYQLLDSDGRGGSRLLAAACAKDQLKRVFADLVPVNVDPHFADLHLSALYTALRFTGYFAPPPAPPADSPPDTVPEPETVLAVECDYDATHVLVARGEQLVGARAIRLGLAGKSIPTGEGEAGAAAEAAPPSPSGEAAGVHAEHHEHHANHEDEDFVVVDDVGDEAPPLGPGRRIPADYFDRLAREVQRTLFKLGPVSEHLKRVLLLGPVAPSEAFRAHLEHKLRMPVEMAKPFDRVTHSLDDEALAHANAEGTAALGVALRLAGYEDGSRVEFRQEEVRYARRFDQVKVALSCLAIASFVLVALAFIERLKQQRVKTEELRSAVISILGEYEDHAENQKLRERVNAGGISLADAATQAKTELDKIFNDLSSVLGRSGTIPRLPSGLDYLNAVVSSLDKNLEKIGRLQLVSFDLDVSLGRTSLKLKGYVEAGSSVDELLRALRACPAVKAAKDPTTTPAKDGRLEISNLEVELVENYDPRSAAGAKKGGTP
jgi:Tfp pilus assembly PilM family ATPase